MSGSLGWASAFSFALKFRVGHPPTRHPHFESLLFQVPGDLRLLLTFTYHGCPRISPLSPQSRLSPHSPPSPHFPPAFPPITLTRSATCEGKTPPYMPRPMSTEDAVALSRLFLSWFLRMFVACTCRASSVGFRMSRYISFASASPTDLPVPTWFF